MTEVDFSISASLRENLEVGLIFFLLDVLLVAALLPFFWSYLQNRRWAPMREEILQLLVGAWSRNLRLLRLTLATPLGGALYPGMPRPVSPMIDDSLARSAEHFHELTLNGERACRDLEFMSAAVEPRMAAGLAMLRRMPEEAQRICLSLWRMIVPFCEKTLWWVGDLDFDREEVEFLTLSERSPFGLDIVWWGIWSASIVEEVEAYVQDGHSRLVSLVDSSHVSRDFRRRMKLSAEEARDEALRFVQQVYDCRARILDLNDGPARMEAYHLKLTEELRTAPPPGPLTPLKPEYLDPCPAPAWACTIDSTREHFRPWPARGGEQAKP